MIHSHDLRASRPAPFLGALRLALMIGMIGSPAVGQTTVGAPAPASATLDSTRRAMYETYLDFDDLVKGGRVVPSWMPDGNSFWYADGGPQDRVIYRVDPGTDRKEPLFDAVRLRAALTDKLGYEPAGRGVPFAQFTFVGPSRIQFDLDGRNWQLNLESYRLERLLPPTTLDFSPILVSEHSRVTPQTFLKEGFGGLGETIVPERLSPDGKWFVSMRDHNIALRATVDGRTVMLTDDGKEELYWDVETVKWNPWSPDGHRLAVFKTDIRGMAHIPTIQWLKPVEEVTEVIQILAGGKLNHDELFILDVFHGVPVHVDLGSTVDQYLVVLGWLPDNSRLLVARYNRLMTRVDIIAADPTTGATRVLMTEQSKTFLTNQHHAVWGTDVGFTMVPDGSGFIWRSERDGWSHLYRYDLNGTLVARLTHGESPVKNLVRVDQKNGWVYYYAHGDQARPYDTHLYRVSLTGAGAQRLTEGAGQHTVSLSPSNKYFVDIFSSVDAPPKSELRSADGKRLMTLGQANISHLQRVGWVPPKEYVVKAADGKTDLWATMYFPWDFDSARKYPVLEYIYGGPQVAVRPMDFGLTAGGGSASRYQNFNRALANLGYLVVILDARGTPERSKAFQDVVYRNWGNYEIADHAGALRQLGARLDFMDLTRVGIYGSSWGGQYAFRGLVQAPDLYKVAISEFPGFDPGGGTLYEVYLGMPQDNTATYDAANPILLASKIRGKLLLTSGTNDTATLRELFKMSEALVRLGIQHDVMVYPNTGHGAQGKSSEYNLQRRVNYFLEHLKP